MTNSHWKEWERKEKRWWSRTEWLNDLWEMLRQEIRKTKKEEEGEEINDSEQTDWRTQLMIRNGLITLIEWKSLHQTKSANGWEYQHQCMSNARMNNGNVRFRTYWHFPRHVDELNSTQYHWTIMVQCESRQIAQFGMKRRRERGISSCKLIEHLGCLHRFPHRNGERGERGKGGKGH